MPHKDNIPTSVDLLEQEGSTDIEMLRRNKQGGYWYRERRQEDWRENYTLYRDKVVLNRLTQRQSVNVPLMKGSIRTLLKDVDDMPGLFFENLDNDKVAEIFLNEYWKYTLEQNKAELMDIVDKKQVFLYGRSFVQMQIVNGKVSMTVVDPQDILVSRFTDPLNIHSSRFLTHTHIFRALSEVEANEDYEQEALDRLRSFHKTDAGVIKAADNEKSLVEKNNRLRDMGVQDVDDPVLGETYVELTLHFVMRNDEKDADGNTVDEQIYMYVEADDAEILMAKPLEEVIGVTKDNYWRTHFPYSTWADDLEKQDFWSDGVADIIRTPNKIVNSMFSQLIENRTLRNFSMYFYNSNLENFNPNTFNAQPWGFYPMPGNPKDNIQRIEVPDLKEMLPELQLVIGMAEKASGATTTQQGEVQAKQVTLGEIEFALTEAKERIKGMSKFYTPAWKERGEMYLKFIEAAPDQIDAVEIHKKGRNTDKIFKQETSPEDWKIESGYNVKVWSQEEKDVEDTNMLQKLSGAQQLMPGNSKVDEVLKKKYLEFAGFTPDEINEAIEIDKQNQQALLAQQNQLQAQEGAGNQLPQGEVQPNQVANSIPAV